MALASIELQKLTKLYWIALFTLQRRPPANGGVNRFRRGQNFFLQLQRESNPDLMNSCGLKASIRASLCIKLGSLDIPRAISNLKFFATLIQTETLESFVTTTNDAPRALNYTVRKPHGVVGVICPWNLPLLLLTWKIAPALATGNTVIIKPSEHTPTSATLLAKVVAEIDASAGIVNVLHGKGPMSVGEMIAAHPGIDAVTFTGSSATGSKIMEVASKSVKPLSFELGGKNAAIVFSDADIEAAVKGVVRSVFSNSGQICLCTERVYVQQDIFDSFVSRLTEAVQALSFDDSSEKSLTLGPLISRDQRDKVMSYFDLAIKEGATAIIGGAVPHFGDERDDGFYTYNRPCLPVFPNIHDLFGKKSLDPFATLKNLQPRRK